LFEEGTAPESFAPFVFLLAVWGAATALGGETVTKPLAFEGGDLQRNFESSGIGGVQMEIQDEAGTPLPGYTLSDCPPISPYKQPPHFPQVLDSQPE
jgi:hypothetical protein